MDYLKAFLIGGLICAGVQVLMEKTKLLPGRIMELFWVFWGFTSRLQSGPEPGPRFLCWALATLCGRE